MVVLVLVVLAAALMTHGVMTERPIEVVIAGILSALGIGAVFVERRLRNRNATEPVDEPASEPVPRLAVVRDELATVDKQVEDERVEDEVAHVPDSGVASSEVVFVAGRTTFHAASCAAVEGRLVSVSDRSQLERGGMTACRRCLS